MIKSGWISRFVRHPVASNLSMMIMLLGGLLALSNLNTQFFPNFEIQLIQVRVIWPNANAEDVERSITVPLEQALRSVNNIKTISSTSAQGISSILIEFPEDADMTDALSRVESKIKSVRNLPQEAFKPEISHIINYEPIARILLYGEVEPESLRYWAYRFEQELLDKGIAKVDIIGLPKRQIDISIAQNEQKSLGLNLAEIGAQINAFSRDHPAGEIGAKETIREIRLVQQARQAIDFESVPIRVQGTTLLIRDMAQVQEKNQKNTVRLSYQGQPAVELFAQRALGGDSLHSARLIQDWLAKTRPQLPPRLHLVLYNQSWSLIRDRIFLLLKNGLGGLVLVVLILFLFLNERVAFWVTAGIPVSFMAALALLWLAGGSINMISLFALIMALGIIVDDAIVVGENALAHYQRGEPVINAVEGGAYRMLVPVLSSSLTTIAAFIPLMLVSGIIGTILFDIPFVVICVIAASLIECFLVLPGHLRHSLEQIHHRQPSNFRLFLDHQFERFKKNIFRPVLRAAIYHPWQTLALGLSLLIITIGLLAGGRLKFTFFPTAESSIIYASASFIAGTPQDRVDRFIAQVEKALYQAEKELGGGLIQVAKVAHGQAIFSNNRQGGRSGDQFASITVELIPSDQRSIRNEQFIQHWRNHIPAAAGLEKLTVASRKSGGPPGRDLEIKLSGADISQLKQAALYLSAVLEKMAGVSGIEDDLPYGKQQILFQLTPLAKSLGLSPLSAARQLDQAFNGYLSQIFIRGRDELELRLKLPQKEKDSLADLYSIWLYLPNGRWLLASDALQIKQKQGFEILRHIDNQLAVTVYADVDRHRNNADQIRLQLKQNIAPELLKRWGVEMSYTGKAEDQKETIADMKKGALFALALIYIVLAWVFASYRLPILVMSIIPFGIVGALLGHWWMGIDLTILSLFGFFGLAGIVVNDSIILIVFYQQLRQQGMSIQQASEEASMQRLRAVLLTSLTTIAGLLPLLFETSLQAQFLIPMAVSISFGLALTTFLVLLFVPALLNIKA